VGTLSSTGEHLSELAIQLKQAPIARYNNTRHYLLLLLLLFFFFKYLQYIVVYMHYMKVLILVGVKYAE
jgi:hypothetical protein